MHSLQFNNIIKFYDVTSIFTPWSPHQKGFSLDCQNRVNKLRMHGLTLEVTAFMMDRMTTCRICGSRSSGYEELSLRCKTQYSALKVTRHCSTLVDYMLLYPRRLQRMTI
jgi:hypothetical protein